jgi:hypothetical protein
MSVKINTELKGLQSLLKKAEAEADVLDKDIIAKQKEMKQKKALIKDLRNKIKSKSSDSIVLTEHAILRYLERSGKIDLDAIKKEILNKNLEAQIRSLGNGVFPIKDGLKARVKNSSIVTVIGNE